jgi:L-threonylcarbamoyladenylate synthase
MSIILNSLSNPRLIQLIEDDSVGVLPTDTIYGLVCSAASELAVKRLYEIKHRHQKPGTVIAADIDQLVELGIPRRYLTAVEQYWPNPISIIIPTGQQLHYLHLGKQSLAVRIPKQEELQNLLRKTGPLLTTSANHPGEEEATTLEQAQKYFGDTIDFYVEGGDLHDHKPSTIIRVVDDAVEVIRQGAVRIDPESGAIII